MNYGFTLIFWISIGLFVFTNGTKQGQEEKQKKKIERYNVLRKGKVIFWNVSETEMFDIMEDLAVECYYNQTLTSQDITYEPYIEEPLNG